MSNTKRFVAKDGILLKPYDGIIKNEILMSTTQGYVVTGATISDLSNSAHTHLWSDITSTPTTISSYGITDAYTKTETNNNFLSANTSYYTQNEANANFLSALTNLNDLNDVNTTGSLEGYYLTYSGGTWIGTHDSTDLSNYYNKQESDANFLSANTSYYTQDQANANFLSASTTIGDLNGYTKTETNNNFLSANTSYYTQDQANANFLSASTNFDSDYLSLSGGTLTGSLTINPVSGYALRTNSDVIILGDLYVSGTTTTVNSENMAISDNLFLLNSGETGASVSRGTAGFLVDRGTSSAVTLCFDESTFTIRVGETTSTINDNTIDLTHTIPLTPYHEPRVPNALTYWNGILLDSAPITVDGNNLIPSGLIDGVDISLLKSDFDSHTGNTNNPHQVTFTDLVSTAHTHLWNNITSTPTTISGYGITDAYTKTETNNNFLSALTNLNDLNDVNTTGSLEGYYLTYSGGTWIGTHDSTDLSNYYNKQESDANFLSANTSYYTQDQVNNLKRYTFDGVTTSQTIDSFPITLTDACHWQYSIRNGAIGETGTIMAIWDNTGALTYTQYSTDELGGTINNISFTVTYSTGNILLSTLISSGSWNIKIRRNDI